MIQLSENLKISIATITAIEMQNECVLIETHKRLYIVSAVTNCEIFTNGIYSPYLGVTVDADFYTDLIEKLEDL